MVNIQVSASYVIELDRWGIKNDGTEAVKSTKGINDALLWAGGNGYSVVKLPAGNYLVDKDSSIDMVSDMSLELMGCLIKKQTNGYQNYVTLRIEDKRNVTVVSGVIEGDKFSHDYATIPGTHEWGIGIMITGSCRNVKIEAVEIKNTTGYGISIASKYNHISWVYLDDLESGTFDIFGKPTANVEWVRSKRYYSLSHKLIEEQGYFMICGNGYGDYGNELDLTKGMVTAYFYDDNNKYLGKLSRRTFEAFYKAYFPVGAKKFNLSYRYHFAAIKSSSTTIRADAHSIGVNIINCYIHDCRTLGIAGGGGQYINIENCEISGIGGAAPGYGIDIEDGYNLNQHLTIRNNHFHDNKNGDVVVISARSMLLEFNKFTGTVSFGGSRGENYVSQYNQYNGAAGNGVSLAGGDGTFVVFRYDHFTSSQLGIIGNAVYENCVFDNTTFLVQSDNYLTSRFRNCRFNFNQPDQGWAWTIRRGSLTFDTCEFNVICKFYYFRDESHLGDWSKSKLHFINNTINTQGSLGEGVYAVDELILDNNTFVGKKDKTSYQAFWAKANKFTMINNHVRDVYFKIEGLGIEPIAVVDRNTVLMDKLNTIAGPERSEFIRLSWFNKVFFRDNLINIPQATVGLRCFTIYAEKELYITGNYFNCDSGNNARMDLYGALRNASNTTLIPSLTAIIRDNIIRNVIRRDDITFTAQLY